MPRKKRTPKETIIESLKKEIDWLRISLELMPIKDLNASDYDLAKWFIEDQIEIYQGMSNLIGSLPTEEPLEIMEAVMVELRKLAIVQCKADSDIREFLGMIMAITRIRGYALKLEKKDP